ncbi:HAD family hydrolase [Sinorhizobium meliloti]|uniref:HAD family hydrolase n=1 Tax=Rhizobium meliloti TaxID=382 RepID=UPI000FD289C8|nr:HAD family hydrolase [Sinorhizobium meliloti]MDW9476802.1 HAD-IA family hydrolase [Sinorhizobium meliloti]MDW9682361.1 HAD-IA family hydrolase [Sinorhizobium meliloti]MDW9695553.1 HAD-IA family hydrolase [Sinorhizobium meliloti]MDW9720419.1 HAD-IA family hydrolase [Sinorhizobium meliloti]MDW9757636.1 HAD-IA family hydrolase [Sinorhizobium meliloti]
MEMKPKLVIFDCDGVLVDSEIIVSTAEAAEITRVGHHLSVEEAVEQFAGVPASEMYRIIEARLGTPLPADLPTRIDARVRELYLSDLAAIAGARETIRTLRVPCCVASSSEPNRLGLALAKTELLELFYPHIFSTVLVRNGKPAPDIFLYAAEKMGVSPADCVVVEDSVAGVTAAIAAGMTPLGFVGGSHCNPSHATHLQKAGAKRIFSRFEDLGGLLEELSSDAVGAAEMAKEVEALARVTA